MKDSKLTAADCARRTGLTVRALRVYERMRLVKPARSAKGWRLYGPEDLVRLNSIVALKSFGLSLAQIRKVFSDAQPALAPILDMQLKTWGARKLAADRAIAEIRSALVRLQSHTPLSIDELCQLLRNADMHNLQTITRELINEHLTPEQEQAWNSWWAQRPEEAAAGKELQRGSRAITEEFLACMRAGHPPDSPKVQLLVTIARDHWLKGNMRQRQLEQLAWNPDVTRAWFALGRRLMARSVLPDDPAEAEKLRQYVFEAQRESAAARAFRPLAVEAGELREAGVPVGSARARKLAKRYAEVCREHDLGDPSVHARWIAAFGEFDAETRPRYEYLARIVSA